MKQILSLALALLPCLAWAQYPSNGNQKITLGEQTTADGLIFRGVASIDTVSSTSKITRANKQDTSAFLLLDTVTNLLWHYKTASNGWIQAGGGTAVTTFSGGTTGLTPSTASSGAVTLGGTLAVANGGTNTSTAFTAGSVVFAGASGTYTQDNSSLFYDNTNDRLGIGTTTPNYKLHVKTGSSGRTSHDSRMKIVIEESLEAYYAINTDNGYGGFRVFSTPAAQIDAAFEYWAPNRRFHFLSTGYFAFNAKDNTERFKIDSTGNIGIGTTNPLALLNVMGTVRINSASAPDANYYLQLENSASQKAKANAWDTYSDSRIKTNRQPIINAIDKVNLLKPLYYNQHDSYVENDLLNIDYNNSYKSLGFIAQEVYEVIPEAVNIGTTNELWAMDYTKLIPILTKAIQEQQALIKALEQRIINLENK